jgi:hypothetical protein
MRSAAGPKTRAIGTGKKSSMLQTTSVSNLAVPFNVAICGYSIGNPSVIMTRVSESIS